MKIHLAADFWPGSLNFKAPHPEYSDSLQHYESACDRSCKSCGYYKCECNTALIRGLNLFVMEWKNAMNWIEDETF